MFKLISKKIVTILYLKVTLSEPMTYIGKYFKNQKPRTNQYNVYREIKNSQDRTQSALTKLADVKTLLGKMPTKVAELKEPIADQESYWQQLSEVSSRLMNCMSL